MVAIETVFWYNNRMELMNPTKRKWDKILLITPLFAFIVYGYSLAAITGNVLFVERIGSEFLPYTYVVNAILGSIAALFVAGSIGKHSVAKLIQVISILGIAVLGGCFHFIQKDALWSYPTFLIGAQILFMLLGAILMWDLALKVCTPLEAKRTFGFFSLGASVGGILAGTTSSLLSETLGTQSLIPIIVGSLGLVFLISLLIQHYYEVDLAPDQETIDLSHWDSVKAGFDYYRHSKLARMLSIILILFYSVRWIGDYEFHTILGEALAEDQFAKISGYVSIVENLGLILMFLFFQHVIIQKMGVLNTLFASPFVVMIPFMVLFFFPIYLVATGVKVITKVINYSTFNSSIRLMYTAIPHTIRSSVTTFIGGNSESGGMLIAGGGLIFLTKYLSNSWIIGIGIGLTLLIMIVVMMIRGEYMKQIIHNLESKDQEDSHNSIENLAEPAYREIGVQELMKMIQRENLNEETVRKIVFSLGRIDNISVIPSLLEIFGKYDITVKYAVVEAIHGFSHLGERLKDVPFTRLNILDTYKDIFLKEEDPDLKIFILEHMKDFDPDQVILFLREVIEAEEPNPILQYQAIKGMKYFHDRGIIKYVKPFLDHKHLMIRASVIIALWQFIELRPQLMKRFTEIMMSEEKDSIRAALFIIAKVRITWEQDFVLTHLKSEDSELRNLAALTLVQIGDPKGLRTVLKHLIKRSEFSGTVARSLKHFPPRIKYRLLQMIRRRSYSEIHDCVEILQGTYLNFQDEIQFLTSSRTGLGAFAGRLSLTRKLKKADS
jgi:ATP/ADP translocase